MRVGAIALMVFAAIVAVAPSRAAESQAGGNDRPAHAVTEKEHWDYERTKANEYGYYPVPEFLRAPELRPPPGSPHIPAERSASGVAYPAARRMLIQQGFSPVKITKRDDTSWFCGTRRPLCRAFPEVIECSGAGSSYCAFLYKQQGIGKYWIISVIGEEGDPPDFKQLRCCGYRPATKSYLEDIVILRPNGRQFRFRYPPPSEVDITPLCSETKGRTPCWVKAPPGYRK